MNSDALALVLLLIGAGVAGAILYNQSASDDGADGSDYTIHDEAVKLANECLWADHSSGFFAHYHPNLQIIIEGSEVSIPAETGTNTEVCREMMHVVHTHDGSGKLHVETYHEANVSLEVFFMIMGVKKTSELIPLCHNIDISNIDIKITTNKDLASLIVKVSVKSTSKTGVEMEALTAASISCLTIYDMCKSLDKNIIIKNIKLISKKGGKSDYLID